MARRFRRKRLVPWATLAILGLSVVALDLKSRDHPATGLASIDGLRLEDDGRVARDMDLPR